MIVQEVRALVPRGKGMDTGWPFHVEHIAPPPPPGMAMGISSLRAARQQSRVICGYFWFAQNCGGDPCHSLGRTCLRTRQTGKQAVERSKLRLVAIAGTPGINCTCVTQKLLGTATHNAPTDVMVAGVFKVPPKL